MQSSFTEGLHQQNRIAEEEADETLLWLELVVESKLIEEKRMKNLLQEVDEVISILASSRITAKRSESSSS